MSYLSHLNITNSFVSGVSAASRGDLDRLRSCYLAGASLNEMDSCGRTGLHVVKIKPIYKLHTKFARLPIKRVKNSPCRLLNKDRY